METSSRVGDLGPSLLHRCFSFLPSDLCTLQRELSGADGAESFSSAPLTDLTKQLRDISVFYFAVTRNIL